MTCKIFILFFISNFYSKFKIEQLFNNINAIQFGGIKCTYYQKTIRNALTEVLCLNAKQNKFM